MNLFPFAPVALALLILFVRVFPVEVIRTGYQLLFFGYGGFKASGPPTWVTLPVVFLAVAAVMAMIGEGVARTFIRFRPLDAYRLDIAGSIAGIAAFSLLSFLDAKPVVWALIVALVMLLLYGRRTGLLQVTAVVALVMLLWSESLSSSDIWSPYYRISVIKAGDGVCQNPRVSVHINDGRAFLEQTHAKYDMILFASTCSSWGWRSCCSRRRTSCSSRCCSAPPGSSTRW